MIRALPLNLWKPFFDSFHKHGKPQNSLRKKTKIPPFEAPKWDPQFFGSSLNSKPETQQVSLQFELFGTVLGLAIYNQATRVRVQDLGFRDYLRTMEKKIETTTMGCIGLRAQGLEFRV